MNLSVREGLSLGREGSWSLDQNCLSVTIFVSLTKKAQSGQPVAVTQTRA
jgi:hypothetical protein